MNEKNTAQLPEASILQNAKQWEGQTIHEEFLLRQYLGGSLYSAVFLTDTFDREAHTAALKLVPVDAPHSRAQFEMWERVCALSHPHLIRIFTAGRCEIEGAEYFYAVMELGEENLAQVLSHRALTEAEARDMFGPALDALAHLHAAGIVHGRLSPSNIMAAGDQLKLSTDKLCRNDNPIIEAKPSDPPEKIYSPAGDMWSLGMTLVEALTQQAPAWDRASAASPDIPETLPSPFRDIARHCLLRNPKERWTLLDIRSHLNPSFAVNRPESVEHAAASPSRASSAPPTAAVKPSPAVAPLQAAPSTFVEASPPANRSLYWIPVALLLLFFLGFAASRMWHSHPRASQIVPPVSEPAPIQPPQVSAEPSPSEPRPASNAVSSAMPERASPTSSKPKPAGSTAAPPVSHRSAPVGERPSGADEIADRILPHVPPSALDTIRGTVRVTVVVTVDSAGVVSDASIDSGGPSKYFANLALEAARQWKFTSSPGSATKTLQFDFTNSGVSASLTP